MARSSHGSPEAWPPSRPCSGRRSRPRSWRRSDVVSDEPREVNRRARDLEAEFRQFAQKLDVPAAPDYATRVQERLGSGSGSTRPTLWRPPFGFTGPLGRLATATIVLVLAMAVVLS